MSIYPGSIPPAGTAVASDTLVAAGHTALHNTSYDEIRAIATKIGTGASTPIASTVLRGTGAGTSAWGQVALATDVSGILPVASGGLGQGSLSGLSLPSATLSSPTVSNPTITGTVPGSATYTTPTLTAPVIADFTSAQHDHGDADDGGPLGAVTATSLATNTIAATGANHITISAGASKLVKTSILRQDDTTNAYQPGNTVTLTGWGVIVATATSVLSEAVTFGITFAQRPIVVITSGGDDASDATTYGSGSADDQNFYTEAIDITTGGFNARCVAAANWTAGNTVFYQWIAIGEL